MASRSVRRAELDAVDSVCPYCGVGCALTYYVDRERGAISFAEGRAQPGSQSRLCVKGRYGWDYAASPQRLTVPLIRIGSSYPKGPLSADVRGDGRGGTTTSVAEAEAEAEAGVTATAVARTAGQGRTGAASPADSSTTARCCPTSARPPGMRHSTSSLAGSRRSTRRTVPALLLGSARRSAQTRRPTSSKSSSALASAPTTSTTARGLCHASSVAALFEGVGSGAVSTTYGDVANADVVIITGSNPTANHPVASSFFKQARRRGTKIIYVDPRASTVAEHADIFVQLKPGTDVAFYNSIMHEVIRLGLIDREFVAKRTSNYDALADTVADYPPELAATDHRSRRRHHPRGRQDLG